MHYSFLAQQAVYQIQNALHGSSQWTRDESIGLFDVYEPSLMSDALLSVVGVNLLPLVFGDLWPQMADEAKIGWDGKLGADPLSVYFSDGVVHIYRSTPTNSF